MSDGIWLDKPGLTPLKSLLLARRPYEAGIRLAVQSHQLVFSWLSDSYLHRPSVLLQTLLDHRRFEKESISVHSTASALTRSSHLGEAVVLSSQIFFLTFHAQA